MKFGESDNKNDLTYFHKNPLLAIGKGKFNVSCNSIYKEHKSEPRSVKKKIELYRTTTNFTVY